MRGGKFLDITWKKRVTYRAKKVGGLAEFGVLGVTLGDGRLKGANYKLAVQVVKVRVVGASYQLALQWV